MPTTPAACLECARAVEPADKQHRYCPYCGAMRVQPSLGGHVITLGCDTFDPSTGEMLAYASPHSSPIPVHPLHGPHRDPAGHSWTDLFGASGMPTPTLALQPFGAPGTTRQPPNERWMPNPGLVGGTARQRNFYLLHEQGQLSCYRDTTLGYVNEWEYPTVRHVDRSTRLLTGFSLVAALTRTHQIYHLEAFDLVRGKPRIELHLQYVDMDACFAGDALYTLGLTSEGKVQLSCHTLASFNGTQQVEPSWQQTLAEMPEAAQRTGCRIEPLGKQLLLVLPNGRLMGASQDGASSPRMLWPNPSRMRVLPNQRALPGVGGKLSLLASGVGLQPVLLSVEGSGFSSAQQLELTSFPEGSEPLVTSTPTGLLYASKLVGGVVEISRAPHEQPWERTPLCSLPGTATHAIARFEAVPYQGEMHLLVLTRPTDNDFAAHFHLVHPLSGRPIIPPVGRPSRDDQFEIAWTAGRMLLMNLTRGQMLWL